jgi:hypothetical protein
MNWFRNARPTMSCSPMKPSPRLEKTQRTFSSIAARVPSTGRGVPSSGLSNSTTSLPSIRPT